MRKLQVLVLEDRKLGKPCTEGCGTDWLLPDNQKLAQEMVARNFGPEVELNFVNLAEAPESYPQFRERLASEGLLLPLLLINNEVKISGYFDFRMLRDMVEVAREVG